MKSFKNNSCESRQVRIHIFSLKCQSFSFTDFRCFHFIFNNWHNFTLKLPHRHLFWNPVRFRKLPFLAQRILSHLANEILSNQPKIQQTLQKFAGKHFFYIFASKQFYNNFECWKIKNAQKNPNKQSEWANMQNKAPYRTTAHILKSFSVFDHHLHLEKHYACYFSF